MARSSQRLKGVTLGNNFDTAVLHGRHNGLLELRSAREAKYTNTVTRLTFFEILPELRIRIYAYAMYTDKPRDMYGLRAPVLAAVCKQMRAECLPVFFSQCTFGVDSQSNFPYISQIDGFLANSSSAEVDAVLQRKTRMMPGLRWQTNRWALGMGTFAPAFEMSLHTEVWLKRVQQQEGITVVLRNVEIIVRCWDDGHARRATADCHLRVPVASRSKPLTSFPAGAGNTRDQPLNSVTFGMQVPEKLQHQVVARVEQVAAAHQRFVDFNLDDLESILKALRYWPSV